MEFLSSKEYIMSNVIPFLQKMCMHRIQFIYK